MNYTVRRGDTPALIAQKLIGNPARAIELVAANPHKRKVRVGSTISFQFLDIGEQLRVPMNWAVSEGTKRGMLSWAVSEGTKRKFNLYGLSGPADSIASAQNSVTSARSIAQNGDSLIATGNEDEGVAKFKAAASIAVLGANTAANTAQAIAADNPNASTAASMSASSAEATQNLSNATQGSADPTEARNNAYGAIENAQLAVEYANTALVTPQPTSPGLPPAPVSTATTAGNQLVGYMNAHGCDGTPTLAGAVMAFQQAYNSVGGNLPVDGQYRASTQAALQTVTGNAPAACAYPGDGGNNGGGGATVPPRGGGTVPAPSGNPDLNNVSITGKSSNTWAWGIAAVAVAAGAGLYYYAQNDQPLPFQSAARRRVGARENPTLETPQEIAKLRAYGRVYVWQVPVDAQGYDPHGDYWGTGKKVFGLYNNGGGFKVEAPNQKAVMQKYRGRLKFS